MKEGDGYFGNIHYYWLATPEDTAGNRNYVSLTYYSLSINEELANAVNRYQRPALYDIQKL